MHCGEEITYCTDEVNVSLSFKKVIPWQCCHLAATLTPCPCQATEESQVALAVRTHRTLELAGDNFYVITCGRWSGVEFRAVQCSMG